MSEFQDYLIPIEALHAATSSYKITPGSQEIPTKLSAFVRSKLPGWQIVGTEAWHDHAVVVYQNRETEFTFAAMAGTAPLKKILTPRFRRNWVRNGLNESLGRTHIGRKFLYRGADQFLSECAAKYGEIKVWVTHSGSAFEMWAMDPTGDIIMFNPHAAHSKYDDRTYAMRNMDDPLTGLLGRNLDQMKRTGFGGHGTTGIPKGGGGIWEYDTWETLFPKLKSQTYDGPPILLAKDGYPKPAHLSKRDLYRARYKDIKGKLYAEWKAEQEALIAAKTKNPRKRAKKLARVWDEKKGHPRRQKNQPKSESPRETIKRKADDAVSADPQYQEQLALHRAKEAIDRGIACGKVVLCDELPTRNVAVGSRQSTAKPSPMSTGLQYARSTFTFSLLAKLVTQQRLRARDVWESLCESAEDGTVAAIAQTALNTVKGAAAISVSSVVSIYHLGKNLYNAVKPKWGGEDRFLKQMGLTYKAPKGPAPALYLKKDDLYDKEASDLIDEESRRLRKNRCCLRFW